MTKDVIVIGAGIGGLTAGAYLAKAGIDVLMLERSEKAGGYCGSFRREGFIFDDAVHYLNNLGPSGALRRICEELDISVESVPIIRIDPSDRLQMPGFRFAIYSDINKTISKLQNLFPSERDNIRRFFTLINNFKFADLYVRYSKSTFQDILDGFFNSSQLKAGLGILATTMGLLPDELSALAGLAYYKGSILDGGYHAIGGAQTFTNTLVNKFEGFGGSLRFSAEVKRIIVTNRSVRGVELNDGTIINCRLLVSNCDVTRTFLDLVGEDSIDKHFLRQLMEMQPSLSNFIVYLGIKERLTSDVPACCNYWCFPFENCRQASIDITADDRSTGFIHLSLPSLHDRSLAPENHESIMLFAGASFKNKEYWDDNKDRLTDVMIERASQVIPNLRKRIVMKFSATPYTLLRYTLNRGGSYRGWAPTLKQTKLDLVPQKTSIKGLLLAGHWITSPVGHGGVSMVAISGRNAAKAATQILKKRRAVMTW